MLFDKMFIKLDIYYLCMVSKTKGINSIYIPFESTDFEIKISIDNIFKKFYDSIFSKKNEDDLRPEEILSLDPKIIMGSNSFSDISQNFYSFLFLYGFAGFTLTLERPESTDIYRFKALLEDRKPELGIPIVNSIASSSKKITNKYKPFFNLQKNPFDLTPYFIFYDNLNSEIKKDIPSDSIIDAAIFQLSYSYNVKDYIFSLEDLTDYLYSFVYIESQKDITKEIKSNIMAELNVLKHDNFITDIGRTISNNQAKEHYIFKRRKDFYKRVEKLFT